MRARASETWLLFALGVACAPPPSSLDAGTDAARPRLDAWTPIDAPIVEPFDAGAPAECSPALIRPRPTLRLVAPISTGRTTTRRPTFRWATTIAGVATLDVCADRACTSITASVTTSDSHVVSPSDLPAGVTFWRVSLRPDDGGATLVSATWEVLVPRRSTPVDTSWGSTLDLDEDGRTDLVVTADLGNVYVYLNGASGLPHAPTSLFDESALLAHVAGDLDGDGHADFVTQGGPQIIHFGSHAGLAADRRRLLGPSYANYLAAAGDVDADGYADLVAPGPLPGTFLFFRGDAGGPGCAPDQTITTTSWWGRSAAIGDVNGDGFGDVASVAENSDGSFDMGVWYGSSAGLGASQIIAGPVWFAGGGDLDGDGYADVVASVGAATAPSYTVQIYRGGPSGLSATPSQSIEAPPGTTGFGEPLAIVGDLDADGFDDLAVAAPPSTPSYLPPVGGSVFVYPGSAGGVDLARVVELHPSGLSFSTVIRPASDVTNDGIDDLVLGMPDAPPVGDVLVYAGGAGSVATSPSIVLACPDTAYGFGGDLACVLPTPTEPSVPDARSGPSGPRGSNPPHTG